MTQGREVLFFCNEINAFSSSDRRFCYINILNHLLSDAFIKCVKFIIFLGNY